MIAISASTAWAAEPVMIAIRSVRPVTERDFEPSLQQLLGQVGAQLGGSERPFAWVDVDAATGALVVECPSRAITVRREFIAGGPQRVRAETIAALIASTIEVLMGLPPMSPPSLAAGLDVGIGFDSRLSGGTPGVDFGVTLHTTVSIQLGPARPGLMLRGAVHPNLVITRGPVRFEGPVVSVRLLGHVEVWRWRWGRIDVGFGGGFDWFSQATSLQVPNTTMRMEASRYQAFLPMLSGLLSYCFPITPNVQLFATLSVDGDLRPDQDPFMPPPAAGALAVLPVLRPWLVRPALTVGVAFAPFETHQ